MSMANQSSEVEGTQRGILWRLVPPGLRKDPDELRRAKLFVVVALLLSAAALFFTTQILGEDGISPAALVLGGGALVGLACIPFARWLGSIDLPAVVIGVLNVLIVLAMGLFFTGPGDSSQWWLPLAPLVSTFLVGPRIGVGVCVLAVAGRLGLFVAGDLGWRFAPKDDTESYFHTLASITALAAVTAIAALYEGARRRDQGKVEQARKELEEKHRQLESAAAAVTQARDRLIDEGRRKDEFLERMRSFGAGHGEGLERTRRASAQLAQTVHDISASIETLATSASSSDATVAGMAESASRVAANVERMVADVAQATTALVHLTGAVAAVQAQYGQLSSSADATARAMVAMEKSAEQAEKTVVKTVGLADMMIKDAARGVEAVRRTLGGVDEIRTASRTAGTVIRDLDQRVRAIGAINNVIDEVAIETNVLALNASIIAAQAGDHGAGFRVVAEQIKALAERTAASTREITVVVQGLKTEATRAVEVIERGESAVDAGAALSEEAARALEQIVGSAQEAATQMGVIETVIREQAGRARMVGGAMSEVMRLVGEAARATDEHGQAAGQIEAATRRLTALGPELEQKSKAQADAARAARAAIAQISEMARRLATVQGDQTRVSEATLRAVEDIQRAQRGQDDALRTLQ
ncbi:MAG: hypothetical protein IT383_16935 [Deltaproteobacteria bacterium]|nr:hypothetical protein [Deltaproteobacteria bacterium]